MCAVNFKTFDMQATVNTQGERWRRSRRRGVVRVYTTSMYTVVAVSLRLGDGHCGSIYHRKKGNPTLGKHKCRGEEI